MESGACIDECSEEAITVGDDFYTINLDLCADCVTCADVCPVEAIYPK